MKREDWIWSGAPGHFCGASECRFHLTTDVGYYRVSTVGEWLPGDSLIWEEFGGELGSWYETMVFPLSEAACVEDGCGCGLRAVATWIELGCQRYHTRGEAQRGHMAMCEKWAAAPPWQGDDEP